MAIGSKKFPPTLFSRQVDEENQSKAESHVHGIHCRDSAIGVSVENKGVKENLQDCACARISNQ